MIKREAIYPGEDKKPDASEGEKSVENFRNGVGDLERVQRKMTEDEMAWLGERIRSDSFLREYDTPVQVRKQRSALCSEFNHEKYDMEHLGTSGFIFGTGSMSNIEIEISQSKKMAIDPEGETEVLARDCLNHA